MYSVKLTLTVYMFTFKIAIDLLVSMSVGDLIAAYQAS